MKSTTDIKGCSVRGGQPFVFGEVIKKTDMPLWRRENMVIIP
jgi:hypothetical protein